MEVIEQRALKDRVYDILKQHIIERQVGPGEQLDLNQLAESMGVSRSPILDALTRLESEGLVIRRNRVGTFVAPLSKELFGQIFEARAMVEDWAAVEVVERLEDQDVHQLRAILGEASTHLGDGTEKRFDYLGFTQCDERFHSSIIALCGNDYVIRFYSSLNSHFHIARVYLYRALERSFEGQSEHENILEAYASRNPADVVRAQRKHLQLSYEGVLSLLEKYERL